MKIYLAGEPGGGKSHTLVSERNIARLNIARLFSYFYLNVAGIWLYIRKRKEGNENLSGR
jgi:hypothetical protein